MATNVEKDIVDLSKSINGHTFTNGWLLDSLRAHDDMFIKLHGKRSVKDVSKIMCLFLYSLILIFRSLLPLSLKGLDLYLCKITFTDSKNDDDYYSTILKVPTLKELEKVQGELDESYAERMTTVHKSECNFYQNFAKILNIPMPKVFKMVECIFTANQEGCIHMEDISRRGKCISHFESVNLSQVKSFIRNLAHMHKNILCATDLEWRGKYLKNATLFGDFVESVDMFIEDFLKKCKIEG